jgi:hypothetical protein
LKKNSLIILIVLCFNLNAQITKWDKPLYYTNPDYENTLQMVYLGAEGFVMRLGENALMTRLLTNHTQIKYVHCFK